MKICKSCMLEKPMDMFYAKQSNCKACVRVKQQAYYAANADAIKAKVIAYSKANKEKISLRNKEKHAANPEKSRQRAKEWADKHPERVLARTKAWSLANPEKVLARSKEWYYSNKEYARARQKQYYQANTASFVASTVQRKLDKMKRTPSWLTKFDRLKIKCLYQLAAMRTRESGEEWHVDHIIPLRGKLVSGLHVPANLRVITASENLSKHNSYTVN